MSPHSELSNAAVSYDWKIIAAASATFIATLFTVICGWFQGRKKLHQKLDSTEGQVTSAILLDNQTIREATAVNRELRDRLLVQCEALHANTRVMTEIADSLEEAVEELKKIRKKLNGG
jgi:hypothetical protein